MTTVGGFHPSYAVSVIAKPSSPGRSILPLVGAASLACLRLPGASVRLVAFAQFGFIRPPWPDPRPRMDHPAVDR